ncbi:MAG: hypothetical protein N2109_05970 [Fimbriimonadales bacterium]|nr:hypothetical protein [Fimbriimonadales bacterium]
MDNANWQVLLLMVVFAGLVLWKIGSARKGRQLYIRPIPGLNAIEEAVGRSAELGGPLLFHGGIADFTNVQTLAAVGILEHICKTAAKYGNRILVTTAMPVMVPIWEDVIKASFAAAGRPELANWSEVRFISPAGDLTALGTTQLLVDEKVSSCFLFGAYDYTSLLYSEGGQIAGCMQIAGTSDYYQIPFFVASCDYVVMVEELFACSAYLTREPTMLGSVVGQDLGKLFLLLLILAGVIGATLFGSGNPLNVYESLLRF